MKAFATSAFATSAFALISPSERLWLIIAFASYALYIKEKEFMSNYRVLMSMHISFIVEFLEWLRVMMCSMLKKLNEADFPLTNAFEVYNWECMEWATCDYCILSLPGSHHNHHQSGACGEDESSIAWYLLHPDDRRLKKDSANLRPRLLIIPARNLAH